MAYTEPSNPTMKEKKHLSKIAFDDYFDGYFGITKSKETLLGKKRVPLNRTDSVLLIALVHIFTARHH